MTRESDAKLVIEAAAKACDDEKRGEDWDIGHRGCWTATCAAKIRQLDLSAILGAGDAQDLKSMSDEFEYHLNKAEQNMMNKALHASAKPVAQAAPVTAKAVAYMYTGNVSPDPFVVLAKDRMQKWVVDAPPASIETPLYAAPPAPKGEPVAWICAADLARLRRNGEATVYEKKQTFLLSPPQEQTPLYAPPAGEKL